MIETTYRDERERIERGIAGICRAALAGKIGAGDAKHRLRIIEQELEKVRRAEERAFRKRERERSSQLGLDLRSRP